MVLVILTPENQAVITGREAANHILLKDNVRQAELVVTNSHGPGLI
jgi:hypothetical protein